MRRAKEKPAGAAGGLAVSGLGLLGLAHALEAGHVAIQVLEVGELALVEELAGAGAIDLGDLNGEARGLLDVGAVRGARGASRDHLLGSDGHAHDGGARGGGGLQDAVQVVQVIAIGRDVLLGEGEDLGHLAGDARHDVHEIVGDGQDVALHDRRRDGDAVQVDDAVALRGVDGDDGVHALVDLHAVHGLHVDGGVHEGDGLVGQRRGVGADVGGHDDVALEHVAVLVHLDELERRGEGRDRAVAVGHGADHLGAGAQAAEAADAKTEPEGEAREITREYFDEVLSRVLEGDYGVCSLESWDKVTYYHYRPLLSCSYARILSAENNPVEQVVDMIRESSRVYPRPVAIGVFEEPPFGIEAEELQEMLKMIAQDPEKQDIRFTTSSIGTVFLYSNKYLEDGYAEFLAEEQDVGAVMNP